MLITLKSLFSSLVCTGHFTERNTSTMFAFISSLVTVNCFFLTCFQHRAAKKIFSGSLLGPQGSWPPPLLCRGSSYCLSVAARANVFFTLKISICGLYKLEVINNAGDTSELKRRNSPTEDGMI